MGFDHPYPAGNSDGRRYASTSLQTNVPYTDYRSPSLQPPKPYGKSVSTAIGQREESPKAIQEGEVVQEGEIEQEAA